MNINELPYAPSNEELHNKKIRLAKMVTVGVLSFAGAFLITSSALKHDAHINH